MSLNCLPLLPSARRLLAFLVAMMTLVCLMGSGAAFATEPVKISREDTALDLTATTEIYTGRGEAFQVSTAPGTDGIVRRIEVRSSAENHQGDWAVFALANVSEEQLERVIVAPHFRLVNSKLFWPDLGSQRILVDHPERRLCARPAAERRSGRVPHHAQPGLGHHLRRRAGGTPTCRRSISGSRMPTRTRSTPLLSIAASCSALPVCSRCS